MKRILIVGGTLLLATHTLLCEGSEACPRPSQGQFTGACAALRIGFIRSVHPGDLWRTCVEGAVAPDRLAPTLSKFYETQALPFWDAEIEIYMKELRDRLDPGEFVEIQALYDSWKSDPGYLDTTDRIIEQEWPRGTPGFDLMHFHSWVNEHREEALFLGCEVERLAREH